MVIELIGVQFDGMARDQGQARAPDVLRELGFTTAFAPRAVVAGRDIVAPRPRNGRGPVYGLLNESAFLAMIQPLYERIGEAFSAGRFPLVFGADCSVLLAAVPALRDVAGRAGLVFVDGHEDATPMELSPDGEVANMEIAMLLGLTGKDFAATFPIRLPALEPSATGIFGAHDEAYRRALEVPSVADRIALHTPEELSANLDRVLGSVRRIASNALHWWLHTDLDVLTEADFPARGAPGETPLAGGLTWSQLTDFIVAALEIGGCRGWSVVIYNPDLDPDRNVGRRVVSFIEHVAPHLP
jgi:arginase